MLCAVRCVHFGISNRFVTLETIPLQQERIKYSTAEIILLARVFFKYYLFTLASINSNWYLQIKA